MFKSITQLKVECSVAAQEAKREFRRDVKHGLLIPRGRYISITLVINEREIQALEGETWRWNGTNKDLERAVSGALTANGGSLKEVSIFGAFNFAESLRDYQNGSYDPVCAEWEVSAIQRPTPVTLESKGIVG